MNEMLRLTSWLDFEAKIARGQCNGILRYIGFSGGCGCADRVQDMSARHAPCHSGNVENCVPLHTLNATSA